MLAEYTAQANGAVGGSRGFGLLRRTERWRQPHGHADRDEVVRHMVQLPHEHQLLLVPAVLARRSVRSKATSDPLPSSPLRAKDRRQGRHTQRCGVGDSESCLVSTREIDFRAGRVWLQ